jgi:FecR protein
MKRRDFIMLISGAVSLLARSSAARAQDPALVVQASAPPAADGSIGQVATVQGSATVTRAGAADAILLQVGQPVFKNDVLATGANSALSVTFDDETTFSLSPDTRIVVNEFVYQASGKANAASFAVTVGTAAFIARLVAKTGDMKITTPVATLGIRGTTGVVDVPAGGTAGAGSAGEPRIKLYADADGYVGQIEVFNLQGGALGTLTQGASAFALHTGPGGRLQAVVFPIPPEEAARDRGLLRRLRFSHNVGHRMIMERRRSRGLRPRRANNPLRPGLRLNPHPHPRPPSLKPKPPWQR